MTTRLAITIGLILILPGCHQPAPKEATKAPVEYFKVDRATAGSISGKILFKGKKPTAKRVDMEEENSLLTPISILHSFLIVMAILKSTG